MIKRDQMFPLLLEACPSFTPMWREFVDEWRGDDGLPREDLPHYLALAEFARHLISMLVRSETSSFPAVFAVVEDLHTQGEHYVREAATIGLLESLQNTNLHDKTDSDAYCATTAPPGQAIRRPPHPRPRPRSLPSGFHEAELSAVRRIWA